MAIGLLALGTATGAGIDFARGLNFKSSLQGMVDAAAIAGASVYLNAGYSAQATIAANKYLTNATANLPANNGVTTAVSLTQSAPFTVTVTASGGIKSSFTGLLMNNIPVSVTATGNGPANPNIDFYLLLDDSPSMAIAATQSGINTMVPTPGARAAALSVATSRTRRLTALAIPAARTITSWRGTSAWRCASTMCGPRRKT